MRLIYIDCSEGVTGEALLGALFKQGLVEKEIMDIINNYIKINFDIKIEEVKFNGFTAAKLICKSTEANGRINAVDFIKHILEKRKIKRTILGGFDKYFALYINALSKVKNVPVSDLLLEKNELIDIAVAGVGYFAALDCLNAQAVLAAPIPIFDNSAFCREEGYPLIIEIAKGAKVKQAKNGGSYCSATGVALLVSSVSEYGQLPEMFLEEVSFGVLKKNASDGPVLRVIRGNNNGDLGSRSTGKIEKITVIETSIDDMNPELFPYLIENLLKTGAKDAFLTPINMKKGRLANLLTVLCGREKVEDLLEIIFKETSTLGVRVREESRRVLDRKFFKVMTPYGEITIKAGFTGKEAGPVHLAPEFEDCKRAAAKQGVPLKKVYAEAQMAAFKKVKELEIE